MQRLAGLIAWEYLKMGIQLLFWEVCDISLFVCVTKVVQLSLVYA